MTIGERVRQLRREGWRSQEEFAIAVGTGQKCISNIEIGKTIPSVFMVRRMSKVLGITIDEFMQPVDYDPYIRKKPTEAFAVPQSADENILRIL